MVSKHPNQPIENKIEKLFSTEISLKERKKTPAILKNSIWLAKELDRERHVCKP
jgi:hypothetical protein